MHVIYGARERVRCHRDTCATSSDLPTRAIIYARAAQTEVGGAAVGGPLGS